MHTIAALQRAERVLVLVASFLFAGKLCAATSQPLLPAFKPSAFDEQLCTFTNEAGVRIHINAPASLGRKRLKLILYGLPNGNSIEQTVGKQMKVGDDWHFDIQHIGAQIRFLREKLKEEDVVIAYLENSLKSWPAWRKQHGDQQIPGIVSSIERIFAAHKPKLVLTGHSGGGSFTFGYLNSNEEIPAAVERIAFLDSNYAYESALHKDKLVKWLKADESHHLVVFAYRDYVALLNGKTFVSAAGGTWGKSELMKADLAQSFAFTNSNTEQWQNASALRGRIRFFLRENPEKKIWHTVQVERNGLIHAMLSGTANESSGYDYFGSRAYSHLIQAE